MIMKMMVLKMVVIAVKGVENDDSDDGCEELRL